MFLTIKQLNRQKTTENLKKNFVSTKICKFTLYIEIKQ